MPSKKLHDLINEKVAELEAGRIASGEGPDPDLTDTSILGGGNIDEREAAIEKLEDEEERRLDGLDPKSESEKDERIKELEAQLEKLNRRWAFGDYSDLPINFPFEITIQPVATAGGNLPAEPNINGHVYKIPRGVPTIVPKALLENLDRSKYKAWEQMLNPKTSEAVGGESRQGVHWVEVEYHRYPYSARPLYHRADELTKWPGIFEDVPGNHLGRWKDATPAEIEAANREIARAKQHSLEV